MGQWFHCARCREDGVTRAKRKAMADNLRAQSLAQVIESAKALCGWMQRRCRHANQCQRADPTEIVLRASSSEQSASQPQAAKPPSDVQDICRRMQVLAQDSFHVTRAEQFEKLQQERMVREGEYSDRRRAADEQERLNKARVRQRQEWDRSWSQGLRPVAARPGRPLDKPTYDIILGGRDYAPPFEMLMGYGEGSIRAAMDAWSRPSMTRQQQARLFFNIARRIQQGFGVNWMTQIDIETNGLAALSWDDKRGPFYSQGGEYESDLPVELYDGGDSQAWQKKQREAEEIICEKGRKNEAKKRVTIDQLLGGIG